MKKKLFIGSLMVILFSVLLVYNVFAARKTELPVNVEGVPYNYSTYTGVIEEFQISKVEILEGQRKNRIYFELKATGSIFDFDVSCYDAMGLLLGSVSIKTYDKHMDVPDLTAMIELSAHNATEKSDTYFYCKYINVYACDGSALGIHNLLLPLYEKVGWSVGITVYNLTGDTLEISPYRIAEYDSYGWYIWEKKFFLTLKNVYDANFNAGKYAECMALVDYCIDYLKGTQYENTLYSLRTTAMNRIRETEKTALSTCDYTISENSIGTPEVSIIFRNVSFKNIVAFKVKFNCYDVFGQLEKSYYDLYFVDDCNLAPAEVGSFTWTLYGTDSVKTLKNIRVTEVVFADGTKWYK